MAIERTISIIKPDAVAKDVVGQINWAKIRGTAWPVATRKTPVCSVKYPT